MTTATETPTNKYVKAHGMWFHYLEWEANGPVAVLAHAAGYCAGVWSPLARSLHQRGYRVLSIDLRGHGDTEPVAGADYTWYPVGRDVADLLEKLDVRDALAIGHSYGAVALMLGEALSPGRTRCGFHMEPPIVFRPWLPGELEGGSDPLSLRAMKRRAAWDSRKQLVKAYRGKPTFKNWREDYLQAYAEWGTRLRRDGQVELKCSPEVEARIYRNSMKPQPDVWEALRAYKPPTQVLVAQPHPRIPADSKELQKLRQAAPSVRVVALEGAGHNFPMEQPEEFERRLWEFVAEVEQEEAQRAAAPPLEPARSPDWPLLQPVPAPPAE